MKVVLMVAEKPSLAQNLANILSNGKCSTTKGSNGACSVHEWNGTFKNEPVRFRMTSVCGHVMSLDFTGKYNNWDKVDPVELFSCPTEKKEAMPRLKMPAFLGMEARGCDYLVLWLDCDKEGENICFELDVHKAVFPKVGDNAPLGRLKPRMGDKGPEKGIEIQIRGIENLYTESELEGDMWRIYDYVTRHFIATLCRDCRYLCTTATFQIGTETFSYSGNTLVDAGYTEVMHWQAFGKDEFVPVLKVDDVLKAHDHRLVECQTSPPDYLTEAEVITLMEKHGIGTDASIPVHINNICQRNYVAVGNGRKLIPTNLGIVLVHGYQKIDPELVLPTMRSAVEEQLNLIAVGRADFQAVLSHTTEIFRRKFQYFVRSIEAMDQLFEVNFSSLKASGKALSRCGKCRRYMRYIQAKPARLHCSHCDDTYALPQNGTVRIYRELKCPLDDFELLSWSSGHRGKSFPLCPYCYNHPPFRDMKKGFGCNSCTHPTCAYGVNSTGVSGCVECEAGVLVLDPAAPRWKLACNRHFRLIRVEKHRAVTSRGGAMSRGRGRMRGARPRNKQPKDKMAQLAAYFV
ncbi:DNA topoisomerase 3-beta-1 [Papilio machaon]|uniref:DNA topoisomerase n=1 Tax=Papilio machaon TaxID=76193 RepID=A0A0N1IGG6_PAPMA|nr:DNA topoisomerase 3-beta-1 [Papilio machaon]